MYLVPTTFRRLHKPSKEFGPARNDRSKVTIAITNIHIAKSRRKRHLWPIDESFMGLIR